ESWSCCSNRSSLVWSIDVIHHEKWVHRQTRRSARSEYASAALLSECRRSRTRAGASSATSATARLRPLAPVGGPMWAHSPARNRLPYRIGVWTNDRIGRTDLSVTGPEDSSHPSRPCPSLVASASQIRSSGHSSIDASLGTWR